MYKSTLSSDERLKSRTKINFLFKEGQQLFKHPLKVFYYINEEAEATEGLQIKFGVTVPKSLHKKAFKRIRLKRKIREAYRLNKAEFLNTNATINKSVDWFFIYIDREGNEAKIDHAMNGLFRELVKRLS